METPFPLVRVAEADPRARGRIIGEETRAGVVESVAIYEETFAHYTGLGWDEVKVLAGEFAPPIEAYDPPMLAELEGIAEGAGLDLADVLAINARSEIMFGLSVTPPPECTVFFAGESATADGHVLLGQNWDWRPRTAATVTIFEVDQGPERPAYFTVAEAGVLGKTGFNEHGIGLTVNALITDRDLGEPLLPMHAVVRGILNSATVEEAVSAVVRARRGASITYTVADANGVGIAMETGPGGVEAVRFVHPDEDLIFHTNHFTCTVPFRDVGLESWADTVDRLATIEGFMGGRRGSIDLDLAKQALSDETGHPDSISRFVNPDFHPVLQGETVTSVIMDLTALRAEVTAGPPSANEYVSMTPEFAARATVR
jgi:isopenicillin-N N-acyltransferase like protein